jgi:hypothetical protein
MQEVFLPVLLSVLYSTVVADFTFNFTRKMHQNNSRRRKYAVDSLKR